MGIKLPYFPELSAAKSNRVITKHFVNCGMYLSPNEFALLTWLIYQSKLDNSFSYSTHLLIHYSTAIKESVKIYNGSNHLSTDIKRIRACFRRLAESGYVLPTANKKVFMVNPMLSYGGISYKMYKQMVDKYQKLKDLADVIQFSSEYISCFK